MKKRLLFVIAVIAAFSLVAAAPVTAGHKDGRHGHHPPSSDQVKPDARPFKAFMTGEMSWAPDENCPEIGFPPEGVRSSMEATGRVSHLGRSTLTGTHCTPGGIYYPDLDQPPSEATLVAANGDKVDMIYHGECPPLTLDIGEVLICSFEFEVDGGTGRFEGATGRGSGTLSMVWLGFGEPRAPAWWSWTGTIGY